MYNQGIDSAQVSYSRALLSAPARGRTRGDTGGTVTVVQDHKDVSSSAVLSAENITEKSADFILLEGAFLIL